MLRSSHKFIKFGIVGTIGFVVDAAVLLTALSMGLDPYSGRAISFLCAVTTTWYLNRLYTFRSKDSRVVGQWAQFASVNLLGGALNYGLYAALIWHVSIVEKLPLIGVAAGSFAGLISNFILSSRLVFNRES